MKPYDTSTTESLGRMMPWLAALTFQFTLTLSLQGSAIRISLADLLVPLALLMTFGFVCHRAGVRFAFDRAIPRWPLLLWGALATAWLTYALFAGYHEIGGWSGWALQNKYFGWYALAFFALSGFAFERMLSEFGPRFLSAYVIVAWGIAVATAVAFLAALWLQFPQVFLLGPDFRAVGMLVNPNAFGFATAIAVILQLSGRVPLPESRWLRMLGLASLLAVFVLTGSRSAWAALAVAIVIMTIVTRWEWRNLKLVVPIAAVFLAGLVVLLPAQTAVPEGDQPKRFYVGGDALAEAGHVSVSHRIEQFEGAIVLWTSAPLTGAGLGVYLQREIELGKALPQQIHNTYLWLLAETGLVGFVLFTGFFVTLLVESWRGRRHDDCLLVAIPILCMFGLFAMLQEALYQRHIWFLAGILMARLLAQKSRLNAS